MAALGWLGASRAEAANPSFLNIDVSITANLSVAVNGAQSSTHTTSWNTATSSAKLVSAATATVTNDSGGQTEKWALSTNANSIDTGGGSPGNWALQTTTAPALPGADQFALQAVFGSSNTVAAGCPVDTSTDWNQSYASPLTASPVTYTNAVFSDTSLNNNGTQNPDVTAGGANGRMFAGSKRALCWRVITPSSTGTTNTQNVQVIITAQNP